MATNHLNDGNIEAAAMGDKAAMRLVLKELLLHTQQVNTALGQAPLAKIDGTPNKFPQAPGLAGIDIKGSGGTVTIAITNPQNKTPLSPRLLQQQATVSPNLQNAPIYHQIQSATNAAFTQGVITYPSSTQLFYQFSIPGQTLFWRMRSSYDQQTWNGWQIGTDPGQLVAIEAGLGTSENQNPNLSLNQSNFANIDSQSNGASAIVRIFNAISGPLKSWPRQSGQNSVLYPAGTVLNVPYFLSQYVAYDGEQFQVKSTLPQVFPDSWVPVGRVNVVGFGSVTLPTVTLVLDGAGHIVGTNWTPGSGLTQPPTFTVNPGSSSGTGGILVASGISGGQITGIQVLSAGQNYNGTSSVTASGGVFSGSGGGGGTNGANTGRLYGGTS